MRCSYCQPAASSCICANCAEHLDGMQRSCATSNERLFGQQRSAQDYERRVACTAQNCAAQPRRLPCAHRAAIGAIAWPTEARRSQTIRPRTIGRAPCARLPRAPDRYNFFQLLKVTNSADFGRVSHVSFRRMARLEISPKADVRYERRVSMLAWRTRKTHVSHVSDRRVARAAHVRLRRSEALAHAPCVEAHTLLVHH